MNSNFFSLASNNIMNIYNTSSDNNMFLTPLKNYWCHICKKSFPHKEENIDIQCIYCNKTFCELINTDDMTDPMHPKNFEPYILKNSISENNNNTQNTNNNNNNINSSNIDTTLDLLRTLNNNINRQIRLTEQITINGLILQYLRNYLIERNIRNLRNYNNYMNNIINQLMINDTNNYGNPPAAKKEIEKLKKCIINDKQLKEFGIENSCAICKDEFKIGEKCLLMPCKHHFHENCLMPWLTKRNSCPVCRYELPTDDKDFEEMKKYKLNRENINNGNSH